MGFSGEDSWNPNGPETQGPSIKLLINQLFSLILFYIIIVYVKTCLLPDRWSADFCRCAIIIFLTGATLKHFFR